MDTDLLSQRLRELRGKRTIQEIAEKVGISRVALGYYESNQRTPDAKMIYKLAKYYGVSADYLIGMSDVKNPNTDIQAIVAKTGLNEKAVRALEYIKENDKERLRIINLICVDGEKNE